eukprot:g117.t1
MGDTERFPEGMPAFIKKIHDLGFKFGLYTDIGTSGCHHPFVGSWPDYQRDANTFAAWKVDYVKFDGCDKPAVADAKTLTCNMSQALNNTGRDMWLNFHCWHDEACAECGNSFRITSDHHDVWSGGGSSTSTIMNFLANSRQTFWGADPHFGWPDADFIYTGGQGCGTHSAPGVRCPGQTDDEYVTEYSVWAIASGQIVLATDPRNMTAFMRSVLLNDEVIAVYKDVSGFRDVRMVAGAPAPTPAPPSPPPATCQVTLKNQHSHASCRLHDSFDCIGGTNTMWAAAGCRGEFTCNGLDTVCDVMNSQNTTCTCGGGPAGAAQVWLRPLAGGGAAAVLHNPGAAAAAITVDFGAVPGRQWGAHTTVAVRDLWQKSDVGRATGSYTAAAVPSHGSVFVTLTP